MPKPILRAQHLSTGYGDFQALFDLSMDVNEGEVVAIIGANGAGKTTLMHSFTGLLPCAADMVTYRQTPIGGQRADEIVKLGLVMVPEGRKLFKSLSIEENLIIGGQLGRQGQWNLAAIYELFPILKERRHFKPTALSGGQQQMVAIGRALMANPEVILFDEISLGLAPIVINDIYAALPQIIGTGTSAIIVEQDIAKALSVSQRFYCLQEGRISLQGNSADASLAAISDAYFGVQTQVDHGAQHGMD